MAASIKAGLGIEPKLIPGGGGIFDVVVDGKTIYSKHDTGRFPTSDEILSLLQGPTT